jgi:error-prone DNA polymerase
MVGRCYDRAFAEKTFSQLDGRRLRLAGKPRGVLRAHPLHASWTNRWHLDVFCASLLNAQPMRLHRPPEIVRDAREHGVEARPVCAMPPGGRVPSNLSGTPMR